MNFNIDVNAFLSTLPIMGKGMLGIFAVTLIIIAAMAIVNAVGSKEDK